MVIDQGTMLDRIDYNVERMATDVQAADKELNVASGYQKRTTKRKIIFLLFLIIVGVFILLLIKPKHHGGPVDDGNSGGGGSPAEPAPVNAEPVSAEEGTVRSRDHLVDRGPLETYGVETLGLVRRALQHSNHRPSRRGG